MLREVITAKATVLTYIEASDGGDGAVVCYLKEIEPGIYAAQREYFSDPAQAKTEYAAIDVKRAETKAAIIDAKMALVEVAPIKGR